MSSLGSLRVVRCGEDGEEDVPMREAAEVRICPLAELMITLPTPQAVEGRGERVHWVEASSLKKEKGCIYVMEDFSTQHYKVLEGKCR